MSEIAQRILAGDASLWPAGNVAPERLGWLSAPSAMQARAGELREWAEDVDAARVVVLGMGGSSLGAETLRGAFGNDRLVVLDTTDPATVAGVPADDSFFLVSSKSGTTLEVQALFAHFWARMPDGRRFAAITDPGTPLVALADAHQFRHTFLNPADIGGRYSVLSLVGLVPAALMGIDVGELCHRAQGVDVEAAVELGLAMGQAALEGRNKLTIVTPEPYKAFGLWVEQLIAESTGKHGRGCVPVPTTEPELGDDRHVVLLEIDDPYQLGAEFFRWQVATAVAGHVLAIDPFDEPNVAESKANTLRMLETLPLPAPGGEDPASVADWLRAVVQPGDYVALQVYLPYGNDDSLERLRRSLRDGLGGAPVTAGYGPRYLHSTGQLHKGGPDQLVAVQIVSRSPSAQVSVPGFPYDLATLIDAQAIGDLESLRNHGRRVLRVEVDSLEEVR